MQPVKLLFQLCFFRGNAASLPYSPIWVMVVLLANFFVRVQINLLSTKPFDALNTFLALTCSYSLMALFIYLILKAHSLQVRFVKTMMAYLGTEILFLLSTLLLFRTPEDIANRVYLLIGLVLWNYAVKISIIKQSLDIRAHLGIFLVISLEMLRIMPFVFFFLDKLVVKQGAM